MTGLNSNPNFSLAQLDAQTQQLKISGAFGLGAIEVRFVGGQVQRGLVDQVEMSPSALQLAFSDATGLDIPLSVVSAWMRGVPHEGYRWRSLESGFEQLGWQILISRAPVLQHPQRIEAVKEEIKVLLGIRLWQ
ncbi:MAG: lipoprotein insertase outer membrane protein LolB [Pseudomonadales bacterium]|nr:lipoprotein insertase outer membrane protein LolB [Pseudomonadales bacterium]